ncbi:MAG: type II toxin-antitoxin system RelE/ParE family toxin [Alphaproteobacteria bacterium]|nr:type II toxin-antitoxin system RelE/ParE family toxin [Alphaproteobacteria bacterium]
MRVVWSARAQADVHDLFAYIALDKPGAAEKVVRRLTNAGERLRDMPLRGRIGQAPKTRELVVTGLPYILVYEVAEDAVHIHRVVHGARER